MVFAYLRALKKRKTTTSMKNSFLFIVLLCFLGSQCSHYYEDYSKLPQIQFALQQINNSKTDLSSNLENVDIRFRLDSMGLEREGYQIKVTKNEITITGGDVNGMMYGGFEVAEQLQLNKAVLPTEGKPYLSKRGIKFNIPLDARTPSYDDTGDAAQKNYAQMWEWSFWEAYLDELALHRYNVLTLWNPHPFPSMVKLLNFPDVALDDVYVTTLIPIGKENEWAEPQMVSSNVIENLKLIKKISIEEKIVFWQKVMQHAKDRGIEIYYFNWNICANGAASPVPPFYRTYKQPLWEEVPGKHGITNQMDNPINVEYYRESVKTFLETYPLVKGIGVTAGEHMLDEAGGFTREQWIWEAYGKGMMDAQAAQPGREIDFIHRVWNTNLDKIMHYWDEYPGSFEASFKYAKARLYSSPYLNFADGHMEAMKKYGLKSWWNLRNDDIFVHRWGDPDYVRAFINHFQKEHTAGFYMGSDGYVWGKEFISKNPELSGQLEIKKHWYNFMLWGRLSYNNQLDKDFFIKKIQNHFPDTDAEGLYAVWQTASKIIPQVNVFHWRNWDYQWTVEACFDERSGFHTIRHFIDNPTINTDSILNPLQFAKAKIDGEKITQMSPAQVVTNLKQYAKTSIEASEKLRSDDASAELKTLLDDIKGMAYLGFYYAQKIEAATELAFYTENKKTEHKNKAVKHLEEALQNWDQYRKISEKNYQPQMMARTKLLDWTAIMEEVKKDTEIAKNFKGI